MNGPTFRPGVALVLAGLAGLAAAAPLAAQKDVEQTIARFTEADSGSAHWFAAAAGYAIFPSVGKGGIGIGGARGKGFVYRKGGVLLGKATLTAVTIGLQLGGQKFSEVIFFEDQAHLDSFMEGNFEFNAQVSAVAVTAGASADAGYEHGVAVFTMTRGGLMYEASVGGQKFSFEPVDDDD